MRRSFEIPAEKEVRFWSKHSAQTYEMISNLSSTVQVCIRVQNPKPGRFFSSSFFMDVGVSMFYAKKVLLIFKIDHFCYYFFL